MKSQTTLNSEPPADSVHGFVVPLDAVPGQFYDHPKWGRVLCVGSSDPEIYFPAFVRRQANGKATMNFFDDKHHLTLAVEQSWSS